MRRRRGRRCLGQNKPVAGHAAIEAGKSIADAIIKGDDKSERRAERERAAAVIGVRLATPAVSGLVLPDSRTSQ
jgi:hypothetical protein